MKSFHKLVSCLQRGIGSGNSNVIVESSVNNQRLLQILQVNGFIDSFFFLNNKKIMVKFKYTDKGNSINKIYKFKSFTKYKFYTKKWYKFTGISQFTIFNTRKGLLTNKELFLYGLTGIPVIGIL